MAIKSQEAYVEEEEKIRKALLKKALGYRTNEVVEEYVLDEDGGQRLAKKKVTKKHVSPDISAMRVLLERYSSDMADEIRNMSDEELLKERSRLLKLIKEEDGGNL